MTVTFGEMQELVLRKAQEDGTDLTGNALYTPAWVKAQLNAGACQFLLRMQPRLFRTAVIQNATVAPAALPNDFLGHAAVRYTSGGQVKWLKFFRIDEFDRDNPSWTSATATDPSHFTVLLGDDGTTKIQVYPTLTAEVANALLIRYTKKPADMVNANDTCAALTWFPHLQSRILIHYALMQLMDMEGPDRQERAAWYRGRFEEDVREATRTLNALYVQNATWR